MPVYLLSNTGLIDGRDFGGVTDNRKQGFSFWYLERNKDIIAA
jgi:hypothetical protein